MTNNLIQRLKDLPKKELLEVLNSLSINEVQEILHTWELWARPKQIPPEGDWNTFLALAGRGFGKTKSGAEWVREQVKQGKTRMAYVCPTNSDIEKVFISGESGILSCCWEGDKDHNGVLMGMPTWNSSGRKLTWKNGARVDCFSAEQPERLRGPQFEAAFCDEICAWARDQATWDMLQMTLRLGSHPRVFIATTPKPTVLLRQIMENPKTYTIRGSTYENKDNLAESFIEELKATYEGTRLGKQELHAEVLMESEGALWTYEMIDKAQIEPEDLPELTKIVVAIDPAITNNVTSDMTGIIVAGIDENGIGYVIADYTFKGLVEEWVSKAISLYHRYGANYIVYEENQGKDLIPAIFKQVEEEIPIKGVFASHAKIARAEPISLLYEKGKVKHVKRPKDDPQNLQELEIQMTTFEGLGKFKSPDRYDAMVWALTELMYKGYVQDPTKLVLSDKKSGVVSSSPFFKTPANNPFKPDRTTRVF